MTTVTDPIKIILTDDHVLFRSGVALALSNYPNLSIVAQAATGLDLLNILKEQVCDVVFLDIEMPDLDGIDTLQMIKKSHPFIKVVMLSSVLDIKVINTVLSLGADSFLPKTSYPETLKIAAEEVVSKGYYMSKEASNALLNRLKNAEHTPVQHTLGNDYSEKEIWILKLLCQEKSNKEIGELVGLSPRTIEAVRDKLRAKAGVKSTAGLVMFAIKNKIIEVA